MRLCIQYVSVGKGFKKREMVACLGVLTCVSVQKDAFNISGASPFISFSFSSSHLLFLLQATKKMV